MKFRVPENRSYYFWTDTAETLNRQSKAEIIAHAAALIVILPVSRRDYKYTSTYNKP